MAWALGALAAAACSTNSGRVVATPTPSPTVVATMLPPAGTPAPILDFEVKMTPRGARGNVTLIGTGCSGEEARIDLFVYDEEGTEKPVNGGPANPDGTWEVPVALQAGRYRVAPECWVANTLVADYTPKEVQVR